jgi:hypothetical protein
MPNTFLTVDHSQTHIRSRTMAISREISFEKVLEQLKSRSPAKSETRLTLRGRTHPPPSPNTVAGVSHAWREWGGNDDSTGRTHTSNLGWNAVFDRPYDYGRSFP